MSSETRRLDLRAIDDRFVPEAARRLKALVAWAARAGGGATAAGRKGFEALRTRPLVSGALLLVAVIAAVSAVVIGNHGNASTQQGGDASGDGGGYSTIGPMPGQQVSQYLRQARARLSQLVTAHPDASTVAIVDLSGYRTPTDVVRLFEGVEVTQVHFRVRVPGLATRPHVAAVSGTGQIPTVIKRSGEVEASTAAGLRRYASTLPTTAPALKQQHDLLLQQAQVAQAESVRLTSSCGCVFAVVVRSPAKRLDALAAERGVRVVDPAPPDSAPGTVGFLPLAPEVTTTVPKNGQGLP